MNIIFAFFGRQFNKGLYVDESGKNRFRDNYFNFPKIKDGKVFTIFRDDNNWAAKIEIFEKYREHKWRNVSYGFFGNAYPQSAADVFATPLPRYSTPFVDKSLEQILFSLVVNQEQITKFLELKEDYEILLLNNNFKNAFDAVLNIVQEFGYSYWVIDQICFLASVDASYSKKKSELLDSVRSKKSFIRLHVANYLNDKYSDDNTIFSLLSEFKNTELKNLKKVGGNSKTATFGALKLLSFPFFEIESREEIGKGLWVLEGFSIIDRLLVLEKIRSFFKWKKINIKLRVRKEDIDEISSIRLRSLVHYFLRDVGDEEKVGVFCNLQKFRVQDSLLASELDSRFKRLCDCLPLKRLDKEPIVASIYKFDSLDITKFYSSLWLSILDISDSTSKGDSHTYFTSGIDLGLVSGLGRSSCSVVKLWETRAKYFELMKDGRYKETSLLLEEIYLTNRYFLDYIPVENFLQQMSSLQIEEVLRLPLPAVLSSFAESKKPQGVDHSKIFNFLDYFFQYNNFDLPGDVLKSAFNHHMILDVAEYVCTPNVIDGLLSITSYTKVVEERLKMLLYVIEQRQPPLNDPAKAEFNELLKEITLNKELVEVSQGRLFITTDDIYRILYDQIDKYADLYIGLKDVTLDRIISDQLDEAHFDLGDEKVKESSKKETDSEEIESERIPVRFYVFDKVYRIIKQEFLFHPFYGLDSCLSVRVRHNHFKSLMRRLFASNNLLSAGGDGVYQFDTKFWEQQITNGKISKRDYAVIARALTEFSEEMSCYIDSVKNELLHIKSQDFNNGLFSFELDEKLMRLVFDEFDKSVSGNGENFYLQIVKILYIQLDKSIAAVDEFLVGKFSKKIIEMIDKLHRDIKFVNPELEILGKILKCRSEIESYAKILSSWMTVSTDSTFEDFYLEHLLDVCRASSEEVIESLSFNVVQDSVGDKFLVPGKFKRQFVDVINNIYMNVVIHSGQELPGCKLDIKIHYSDKRISVVARNQICKNLEEKSKSLLKAKAKMASKDELKEMTQEGGTGIVKIVNILKRQVSPECTVDFQVVDDSFEVLMNLTGKDLW